MSELGFTPWSELGFTPWSCQRVNQLPVYAPCHCVVIMRPWRGMAGDGHHVYAFFIRLVLGVASASSSQCLTHMFLLSHLVYVYVSQELLLPVCLAKHVVIAIILRP